MKQWYHRSASQPTTPISYNRDYPVVLCGTNTLSGPANAVGPNKPTPTISSHGVVYNFGTSAATAGTNYINLGSGPNLNNLFSSSGRTLHILFRVTDLSTPRLLAGKSDNGITAGWDIFIDSSNKIQLCRIFTVTNDTYTSSDAIVAGKWYMLSITHGVISSLTMYLNGVKQSLTDAPGSGTSTTDSAFEMRVGSGGTTLGSYSEFLGDIGLFVICPREQKYDEVMEVYRNPWSIFTRSINTSQIYVDLPLNRVPILSSATTASYTATAVRPRVTLTY